MALAMLAEGTVDPRPMITHRFPLAEAITAFEIAENKDRSGAVKVVLENGSAGN
jgi:threonine dehydrogenase-like Zn-dependent dehydrogenase